MLGRVVEAEFALNAGETRVDGDSMVCGNHCPHYLDSAQGTGAAIRNPRFDKDANKGISGYPPVGRRDNSIELLRSLGLAAGIGIASWNTYDGH